MSSFNLYKLIIFIRVESEDRSTRFYVSEEVRKRRQLSYSGTSRSCNKQDSLLLLLLSSAARKSTGKYKSLKDAQLKDEGKIHKRDCATTPFWTNSLRTTSWPCGVTWVFRKPIDEGSTSWGGEQSRTPFEWRVTQWEKGKHLYS